VVPEAKAFQAAAANADWARAEGYYLILTNQSGAASWPITGASFILMHADSKDANTAAALKFFDWAYKSGQPLAEEPGLRAAAGRCRQTGGADLAGSLKVNGKPVWPAK
jgi:phosphate transport system substrate-binding protein